MFPRGSHSPSWGGTAGTHTLVENVLLLHHHPSLEAADLQETQGKGILVPNSSAKLVQPLHQQVTKHLPVIPEK